MLTVCFGIAALAFAAARFLDVPDGLEGGPAQAVRLFHDALRRGRLEEIGNFFSFRSAWQYWRDMTASLCAPCPGHGELREMLIASFGEPAVRAEAAAYEPGGFREKVIASVASVVFVKKGAPRGNDLGVASVVNENGRWKVRTFPGVFPGPMLSRLRLQARSGGEEGMRGK